MERHRSLYRENFTMQSPREKMRINREMCNKKRASQRNDHKDQRRNIMASPLRSKKGSISATSTPMTTAAQDKEKENTPLPVKTEREPPQHQQQITDKMAGDRLIVTEVVDPEKLSRKKEYVQRYIKWKEEKKAKEVVKKQRIFLPVGIASVSKSLHANDQLASTSFAPMNHEFRPPANLRNAPQSTQPRKSLYMVVSTPKKASTSSALARNPQMSNKPFPMPQRATITKPPITKAPLKGLTKLNAPLAATSTATASLKVLARKPGTAAAARKKIAATQKKCVTTEPVIERNARATAPKPAAIISKDAAPITGGAIGKARLMQRKPDDQLRMNPKNVKHSVNFKAKNSNSTATTDKQGCSLRAKLVVDDQATRSGGPPHYVASNPFVKSTTIKNKSLSAPQSGQEQQDNFDTFTRFEQYINNLSLNFIVDGKNDKVAPETGSEPESNADNAMLKRKAQSPTGENKEVRTKPHSTLTTPTRDGCAERPLNYLSPFVSVARGKVNARTEREKRNSIYLTDGGNVDSGGTGKSEMAVESRRTLAAVKYYRQQLCEVVKRLEDECERWMEYKMENVALLQETGGDDMINATIGQTRLLITKKLMQFSGLIDRCEASATGIGARVDDGSEGTKKINPADLEGFWCMIVLQVDNIDKRFDNLKRWKSNDWCDPEAQWDNIEPKPKPLTNKVKKRKPPACNTRVQGSLIKQMKKLYAQNCNKKADAATSVVATTPQHVIRGSVSGTPNSPSKMFFVRDRKSFSMTPTILKINTRQNRSSVLEQSLKEPKPSTNDNKELRRTAILQSCNITPPRIVSESLLGRKSILKTPSSAKSSAKNVLFSEMMASHKFNFIVESDEGCDKDDDIEPHDGIENTPPGSYKLRSREVILRPSCEIVIPQKK